jgi:acyl dehydratase
VRFTKPVALGDTVRLEGRVISADAGSVRGEIVARNQRGEEVLTGAFEGELPEAR